MKKPKPKQPRPLRLYSREMLKVFPGKYNDLASIRSMVVGSESARKVAAWLLKFAAWAESREDKP